jgi:DNA-binding NarL/FixJ family response regulator
MISRFGKHKLNNADKWSDLPHLYKTKMTMEEIAKHLHVSLTSLYSKVKELGLTRERRYKKKPIDITLFKELLALGAPDKNIAKKLGVCPDTVIKLKKQYGFATDDEQKISKGKKAAKCRAYYKKTGTRPECPTSTNRLEKYADDIIDLLEAGVAKTEIAKRYGVCPSTVYNFIHLYDIDAPVKKVCDGKEQQIKKAFEAGMSVEKISQKLNCHQQTAYKAVRNLMLSRSQSDIKRKSILNDQEDTIRQLYEKGLSGTAIAELMGVSYPSLYEFIHRKQFERRPSVHRSIFDGHDEELLQMRQEGKTLKQIGAYFGVGANTVSYRIQKLQAGNN